MWRMNTDLINEILTFQGRYILCKVPRSSRRDSAWIVDRLNHEIRMKDGILYLIRGWETNRRNGYMESFLTARKSIGYREREKRMTKKVDRLNMKPAWIKKHEIKYERKHNPGIYTVHRYMKLYNSKKIHSKDEKNYRFKITTEFYPHR